ncbi:MAG TPA: hydroxymethylglutaryl-CoA lyase [Acidimicrobiales bacterium]|nr:hydroxymethylglutaryl-CoA lyase [Acidimicrobiales bacterium]
MVSDPHVLRGERVVIRDVGPRDGLQPERPVPATERARLIDALFDAGVRHVEVAAFVSPKAVPAMADPTTVLDAMRRPDDGIVTVLVPNLRGAQDALECAIDELTLTISASEAYNQHNVNRSIAESLDAVTGITRLAEAAHVPVDAVVSCAFGSPFEGDLAPTDVATLGDQLLDRGCTAVTYADTTGMATPRRIAELIDETGHAIGLHLHQTRGTALLNAWTALQLGVRRFDTSVGGLGGSPFAPGAAGNLATEEFIAVLDDVGVVTGIDVEGLIDAARLAAELVGHDVPSTVAAVGPRDRLVTTGE